MTEHYNSVVEKAVSFLGIHKGELDIYIGFSPALHLQCGEEENTTMEKVWASSSIMFVLSMLDT